MNSKTKLVLTIVLITISNWNFAQCFSCEGSNTGAYANAMGFNNTALGAYSSAFGLSNHIANDAVYAVALGSYNNLTEGHAVAIGSNLAATGVASMVIGVGEDLKPLVNPFGSTLMVGFRSNIPTFFVGCSNGEGTTGQVGIGNTGLPLAKLHLRADEGEVAAIYVQPHNWLGGDVAGIYLGNFLHGMKADTNMGITFLSEKDYVFGAGNVGLGVEQPKAKLHIDGNILFENPADGFIMKSENGQCWKVTINNDGSFNSTMVDCENFSGTQNNKEDQHTPLYFYPNPTSGLLKIDNRSNTNGWVVEFRSLSGTLLKSDNLASGTNQFDLNFAADGMLIVSVYDQQGNMVTSEKIVVK